MLTHFPTLSPHNVLKSFSSFHICKLSFSSQLQFCYGLGRKEQGRGIVLGTGSHTELWLQFQNLLHAYTASSVLASGYFLAAMRADVLTGHAQGIDFVSPVSMATALTQKNFGHMPSSFHWKPGLCVLGHHPGYSTTSLSTWSAGPKGQPILVQ